MLERALHINETVYGPDNPLVANTLELLAVTLRALGEPATARLLLERALHIYETTYGPNHPHLATILNNLAQVLGALGELV